MVSRSLSTQAKVACCPWWTISGGVLVALAIAASSQGSGRSRVAAAPDGALDASREAVREAADGRVLWAAERALAPAEAERERAHAPAGASGGTSE